MWGQQTMSTCMYVCMYTHVYLCWHQSESLVSAGAARHVYMYLCSTCIYACICMKYVCLHQGERKQKVHTYEVCAHVYIYIYIYIYIYDSVNSDSDSEMFHI